MIKVTNHNKGNYRYVSNGDGAVMYGTITMSQDEWSSVYEYLKLLYIQLQGDHGEGYYTRISLEAHNPGKEVPAGTVFSLGVSPTSRIFQAFNLPNYKRQNYCIEIKDNKK